MDHPQRGKHPNRRRRSNKSSQQQQQRHADARRSENAFITEPQTTKLADLGKGSYPRTCPLTISTRGIGLTISRVTSVMRQRLRNGPKDIPVAAIYRASLAQLEAKMYYVKTDYRNPYILDSGLQHVRATVSSWSRSEAISQRRHNLSQVALIIDSVGNVEVNGKNFVPVFLKEPSPNALNIRLDNLGEYCEKMSKLETDPSERIQGYELNSIPNAKWERRNENDEKSIVLTNPDEIIPPDYDWNNIHWVCKDLNVVSDWLYELYRTESSMREWQAMINYGNKGDPGMLVSTHVVPGQSLKLDNDVISGSQSQFWSSEPIPHASWCVGALSLVGETLNPMDGSSRSNVGPMRIAVDWHEISDVTA